MGHPAPELLLPILEVVPLQLLAYHIAVNAVAMSASKKSREECHSGVTSKTD